MRDQLSPVRTTARWATILAGIAGVTTAIGAVAAAYAAGKAQDFLDGEISEDAFLDANSVAPLASILSNAAMVAAAVFGAIWMFRISKNVRILDRATTFAPVFAIVGWIMPPMLYVIPLLVLRELWQASDPDTAPGAEGWRASGENPLLYVWFVLYAVIPLLLLAVGFSSMVSAALNFDTSTESQAEFASATSVPILLLSGVATLVAAGSWMLVVKRLTERHVELTGET